MTLEELKKEIRPLDETSMEQARKHWIKIAKPLFSLGKLEDAVIQMAGIKETPDYELKKKALVIMCADNGIVEEGVTQTGQEEKRYGRQLKSASEKWNSSKNRDMR